MEGVNWRFLRILDNPRVVEDLRKLKDFNDQLSNEKDNLKIELAIYNNSKALKLWSCFFNKIGAILKLGKLLTWCNKT